MIQMKQPPLMAEKKPEKQVEDITNFLFQFTRDLQAALNDVEKQNAELKEQLKAMEQKIKENP